MVDTANLSLPLLDAAQAQKHVTLNEALSRIDGVLARMVTSASLGSPPVAVDGAAHIVQGGTGAWTGHDTQIAVAANGGWQFFAPPAGWRVWSVQDGAEMFFDGTDWHAHVAAVAAGSALTVQEVQTFDHDLGAGSVSITTEVIADKSVVLGISARVIEAITGASSWSLGVPGSADRYGSGFGTGLNSFAEGVTGQPVTYYGGVPVEITASGGAFTGGRLRVAVHAMRIAAPAPI